MIYYAIKDIRNNGYFFIDSQLFITYDKDVAEEIFNIQNLLYDEKEYFKVVEVKIYEPKMTTEKTEELTEELDDILKTVFDLF